MIGEKACCKCGELKSRSEFYRATKEVSGLQRWCKQCQRIAGHNWVKKNPEKHMARTRRWRMKNTEKHNSYNAKHRRLYPAFHAARSGEYRATQLRATPSWANRIAMGEYYAFAAIKSKMTGQSWQVDHIVPLKSPIVCGLHTDYNLQVIRSSQNQRKSNRAWPDMP